jgi:hypothetical protein
VYIVHVERRGRVMSTLALYSGDLRFESLPGDRLCVFRGFIQSILTNNRIVP